MDWDKLFWLWFGFTILVLIFIFLKGVSLGLIFFLQFLLIVGIGLEKISERETVDRVVDTQKTIYNLWLRTSKLNPDVKVKKKLLEKLSKL